MADAFAARMDRARVPLRLAYVGIILFATLSFLRLDIDPESVARRVERVLRVSMSRRNVVDGVLNVLLFAGWGLVWMVTSASSRSLKEFRNAVLTGAGLSLTVEALQLLSRSRVATVLDLAANTGGALFGALALLLVARGLASAKTDQAQVGLPAAMVAIPYGAACFFEAFYPLRGEELRITVVGGSMERLVTTLLQFRWSSFSELPLVDFFLFAPAGAFAAAALAERGRPYRWSVVAVTLMGGAAVVLAEVGHGALGMEIRGGAASLHVVAIGLGALGMAAWPGGVRRPRLLVTLYSIVMCLWAFRPYRLESTFNAIVDKVSLDALIPLRSLAQTMGVSSVTHVVTSFLLYVPLGALLAVWPLRPRSAWSGFAPAIYLAIATTLLQVAVATRSFDVTDLTIQATGAAVAWAVVRRAGFPTRGLVPASE